MEEIIDNDAEFLRNLNKHPHLKARMKVLLRIANAAVESGEMTADEVEIQLQQQIRELGQDTMQTWAISKEKVVAEQTAGTDGFKRHGKKNFIGTRHSGK